MSIKHFLICLFVINFCSFLLLFLQKKEAASGTRAHALAYQLPGYQVCVNVPRDRECHESGETNKTD